MDRPEADEATLSILESLRHVVRELRVSSRAAEAQVGISGAQLFVLRRLSDAGVLSLGQLAVSTLTHPSSVSTVVQRLVEGRLVARRRAADDARRHELAITPKGRAVLAKAPDTVQPALIEAIKGLAPSRRRALARDFGAIVRAMGVVHGSPSLFFEDDAEPTRRAPAKRGSRARA